MSWVAIVDTDRVEQGCVWDSDITALTIEPGPRDVETQGAGWTGAVTLGPPKGHLLFAWVKEKGWIVGVFDERHEAVAAMEALATHVDALRTPPMTTTGGVALDLSSAFSAEKDPTLLGPKSMTALRHLANVNGRCSTFLGLGVSDAVVSKLLGAGYITEEGTDDGVDYVLTDKGRKAIKGVIA